MALAFSIIAIIVSFATIAYVIWRENVRDIRDAILASGGQEQGVIEVDEADQHLMTGKGQNNGTVH
jgi:hypothetical protein